MCQPAARKKPPSKKARTLLGAQKGAEGSRSGEVTYVTDACDYSRGDLVDIVAGIAYDERANSHSDCPGSDLVHHSSGSRPSRNDDLSCNRPEKLLTGGGSSRRLLLLCMQISVKTLAVKR